MIIGFTLSLVLFVPVVFLLNRLVVKRFTLDTPVARRRHALMASLIQLAGLCGWALLILLVYWLGGMLLGYEVQKEMTRGQYSTPVPLPFLIYGVSTFGAAVGLALAPFAAGIASITSAVVGVIAAPRDEGYFRTYQVTSIVATLLCFWVFCGILTMGQ